MVMMSMKTVATHRIVYTEADDEDRKYEDADDTYCIHTYYDVPQAVLVTKIDHFIRDPFCLLHSEGSFLADRHIFPHLENIDHAKT